MNPTSLVGIRAMIRTSSLFLFHPDSATFTVAAGVTNAGIYEVTDPGLVDVFIRRLEPGYSTGVSRGNCEIEIRVNEGAVQGTLWGDYRYTLAAFLADGVVTGLPPYSIIIPDESDIVGAGVHHHWRSGTVDVDATFSASVIP